MMKEDADKSDKWSQNADLRRHAVCCAYPNLSFC
ncbi:hypothetical protein Pvag_2077 [Pantoea vagans C9-1]|nr:hypothetical protein Pvag_2077 [Pantoea vagans C9-1]